ncbi:MAG: hypothetical protein QOE93_155 [Actinomycetota bacterium]|jgi:hypothetical protein|nr:hypothetical protein [Actinomycetota bacterium]
MTDLTEGTTFQMAQLHVALEEGFSGDDVTVRVAGKKAFEAKKLRTRLQVGLAGSFDVEVADGHVDIVLELPKRKIVHRHRVTVAGPTFVGISLDETHDVVLRTSSEPFGYV